MIDTKSEEFRKRLTEVISKGLVAGLGDPEPGKMCIEAAIMFARGGPHKDTPPCVAQPDRSYAIKINDAGWSSPKARADALLPLALAQLNTKGKDRSKWTKHLAMHTVKRILPMILRKKFPELAEKCAAATNLREAKAAADAAYAAVAYAAYAAAAAAYAAAADAAAYAADAAAYAAAYAAAAASAAGDSILRESVKIALEAYVLYPGDNA